jgi:hypothetical protein
MLARRGLALVHELPATAERDEQADHRGCCGRALGRSQGVPHG